VGRRDTTYLKSGSTLGTAAPMANHSSTRTTQLYDQRLDDAMLIWAEGRLFSKKRPATCRP